MPAKTGPSFAGDAACGPAVDFASVCQVRSSTCGLPRPWIFFRQRLHTGDLPLLWAYMRPLVSTDLRHDGPPSLPCHTCALFKVDAAKIKHAEQAEQVEQNTFQQMRIKKKRKIR
ncbi:unnamed protein product, partial [Ixodes persulcatus]